MTRITMTNATTHHTIVALPGTSSVFFPEPPLHGDTITIVSKYIPPKPEFDDRPFWQKLNNPKAR